MIEPTQDEITEWKRKFGNIYSIDSHYNRVPAVYVFRPLTLKEYESVVLLHESISSAETEEQLVSMALLFPEVVDFEHTPAGLVSSIAEEIFAVSAFNDPKQAADAMEEARGDKSDVTNLMKAMVLAAMPAYKEEDLDTLTFLQLAQKVALAEQIIEVQKAIAVGADLSLEITDPEEAAEEYERKRQQYIASRSPGAPLPDDPIARKLKQAF